MSRIRSANTTPELKVRKALHGRGLRFRVNVRRLPGTPDIVLAKYRTAIFINGCFWHGHDKCRFYTHPKTNPEFWEAKVFRNKERDALAVARLEAQHWQIITIWECELKKEAFDKTIEGLLATLASNQRKWEDFKAQRKMERASLATARKAKRSKEYVLTCTLDIPGKIIKMSEEEE